MHLVRRIPSRTFLVAILVGLALIGFLFVWNRGNRSESDAIRSLSDEERGALYRRTLETLQTVCAEPVGRDGLSRRCRDEADFIVKFPECDEACKAIADRHRERAVR